MCLENVKSEQEKMDYIDKMDVRVDGYIWLWRGYTVRKDGFLTGQYWSDPVYEGKNTCKQRTVGYGRNKYKSGFHCWTTRAHAKKWNDYEGDKSVIVPVKVKKSWITSVGIQRGISVTAAAVVCKHIII